MHFSVGKVHCFTVGELLLLLVSNKKRTAVKVLNHVVSQNFFMMLNVFGVATHSALGKLP